MAALDFPTSPTVGQKYPVPAVAGQPVYTWDGEKWTTIGGAIDSGGAATATPLMDNTPGQVGATTKYAREDHVHPVDTKAVRTEVAQTLTAPQQQQARKNIFAAPFDALAYNGIQVNGAVELNQAGLAGIGAGYFADCWQGYVSGTMSLSFNAYGSPTGLTCYLGHAGVTVNTAQTTLSGANQAQIYTQIEGWRCARLNWGTASAQPVTLAFWSNHNRAGLYSGTICNGAGDRSYAFIYTQTAGTWQYNTVTIPGDTGGTWLKDTGVGMVVHFAMALGSSAMTTANVWTAGNFTGATGQVNGVAATSDAFRLAGLMVLPGSEAPTAAQAPFATRHTTEEYKICHRYLNVFQTAGLQYPIMHVVYGVAFPVPIAINMRAAPSVSNPFTDGNFANNAAPSATQWAMTAPGHLWVSKTGAIISVAQSTAQSAGFYMYGATYNNAGTQFLGGSSFPQIIIDARL